MSRPGRLDPKAAAVAVAVERERVEDNAEGWRAVFESNVRAQVSRVAAHLYLNGAIDPQSWGVPQRAACA